MHPLDNPIWRALTTRLVHLGVHRPTASVFEPDVNLLGGFADAPDYAAMAELVAPGARVGLFMAEPNATPGFALAASVPLVQMIYDGRAVDPAAASPAIAALGPADLPDMLALAALTQPGPFMARTPAMGPFVGIRSDSDGALVAMAGQRLRVPGHTEISAICTHPGHLGRGHAAALTRWHLRAILEAGETPFLHARGDNDRAIALYERLGFSIRTRSRYISLERAS